MFRKVACKLPVSVDAKPFNVLAAQQCASPMHCGHPEHAHDIIQSRSVSSHFGGSAIAALAGVLGVLLFGLTYGYHIGKPVYDAYMKGDDDDDDDDGSD